MKADITSKKKRSLLQFGPGTIIALLAAVGIMLAGRYTKPLAPERNAGRIIFEADREGQLRRVDAPSGGNRLHLRIWKQDPGFLLKNALALKLDSRQRREIAALNADWLSKKIQLEQEISSNVAGANAKIPPAGNASITQVTDSLKGYSQLSRQYNDYREDYWRRSLTLLTSEQRARLDKIEMRMGRTQ